MTHPFRFLCFIALLALNFSCQTSPKYDLVIRNATLYDGSGDAPIQGDIAISGDTIAAMGEILEKGKTEVDAKGMAVSPGFVNMLSWGTESLLVDGRGLSDLKQGITLEVMGEGWSMGPLNDQMKKEEQAAQGDLKYDISWKTLGEYLQTLEKKGVAPNVASFLGATTLRIHEIGYDNREPSKLELDNMKLLARQAMEEGALGIGSSMIYAPATYASTEELIALCEIASEYGGMYITHMRSEGNKLLEAVDEVLVISKDARIPAEIYHLKAGGKNNWSKMDQVITKIDSAQKAGLKITANMYTYVAGATGLDAAMPTWAQEGGYTEWVKRLQDPSTRKRIIAEMKTDAQDWENLYFAAGSADKIAVGGIQSRFPQKIHG
nr:hypothetical protein [Haliscomenobacter sp.]